MIVKCFLFVAYLVVFISCAAVREVQLNKGWTLINQNGSIEINNLQLPSGVYSALSADDPDKLFESYNDVDMRWIAKDNWTYSLAFPAPINYEHIKFVNLTFHGIDTVSTIKLNSKIIGRTNNMFLRYSFNISGNLKKDNVLEVAIKSPIYEAINLSKNHSFTPPECPPDVYHGECHMNFLRKMQASFGWDWGLAAPSMGIWKSVTLEIHDCSIIRDIDAVATQEEDNWNLFIRVFLETGMVDVFSGNLTIHIVDLLDNPINERVEVLSSSNPIIEKNIEIPNNKVQLWWPNGYGDQKLYHLHFTWRGQTSEVYDPRQLTVSQKSIRIGFRTIELVEEELSDGASFYFKVNNIPIFMKGSNWIPSHILPEKSNDENRIKHLLLAAKQTHMNMLRVWGGGVYESEFFYDMADYYGILIWQDMMFACAMYPVHSEFLQSVREETMQNAKRLSHHPSIAIWAGNNENEVAIAQNWYQTNPDKERFSKNYRQLYVGTIYNDLNVILHNNNSRPDPLISSPSNGFKSKEEGFLSANPQDPKYGDIHFYDYILDAWDPVIFPKPRFSSEYGFQSFPAMTSWQRVMEQDDNLTELIDHRQHHPLRNEPVILLIEKHLPLPDVKDDNYLEALIYFSQISQAMATKTETEVYRSQRNSSAKTMGALYWQLNDVWIAPSWSSIDFDGNFKLLHYWARDFLAPITVIAHRNVENDVDVYIVRDTIDESKMNLTATMNIYNWSDLLPKSTTSWWFVIEPNSVRLLKTLKLEEVLVPPFNRTNCFLEFTVQKNEVVLSRTFYFPRKIKTATGITDPRIEVEIASDNCQKNLRSISLAVSVSAPAVFVYIELTRKEIINYKLSKNGYMQLVPIETIHLEFYDSICVPLKSRDIKVLTVNQFMQM